MTRATPAAAMRMRPRTALAWMLGVGFALFVLVMAVEGALQPEPARTPPVVLEPAANDTLRVHYVSVGQGDATVWELPGGGIVVYDCGPPAGSADENPLVVHMRDAMGLAPGSVVHALVASHGHLDHIGGCDGVFETYEVLHVYETWYEGEDAPRSYERFQEAVLASGATLHRLAAPGWSGATFAAGDELLLPEAAREAGVEARILWPAEFVDDDWAGIAKSSIVVRLAIGPDSACFQGDIEIPEETALAQMQGDVSCDIYLVGHHGSRHASSTAWLTRMAPRIAVASFGENPYGHPTSEALCRVQEAGASVFTTHGSGTLIATLGAAGLSMTGEDEAADYCASGAGYWD